MTSTSVVNHIKKILNCKKAGHTGTLDPQAAGVLPICIGKGTKVANYILAQKKTYICEATLGKETDTGDIEGTIISRYDNFSFNKKDIEQTISEFKGNIIQIPPTYSAIRHKGKRLYEWAREGRPVEPKARRVTIYDIELMEFYHPDKFLMKIQCSKGTYIRSLCRDIGRSLGCGAYMSFLLRTQTGSFHINDSFTLDEIRTYHEKNNINDILSPIDSALTHLDYVIVDDTQFHKLINGNSIHIDYIQNVPTSILAKNTDTDNYIRVYCRRQLIGIGVLQGNEKSSYLRIKRLLI